MTPDPRHAELALAGGATLNPGRRSDGPIARGAAILGRPETAIFDCERTADASNARQYRAAARFALARPGNSRPGLARAAMRIREIPWVRFLRTTEG